MKFNSSVKIVYLHPWTFIPSSRLSRKKNIMLTFTNDIEEKTLCCDSQSCKYSSELRWYPGEGDGNPLQYSWGFPAGSDGKESACNQGDLDLIPGLGRSPGGGNGNPLQYSCLENTMDRGTGQATVHGIIKSWTGYLHLRYLFKYNLNSFVIMGEHLFFCDLCLWEIRKFILFK